MKTYLYPQNLRTIANLWLWYGDFAIMCVALLLPILILSQTGIVVPLALTLAFAFLSIRFSDTTVLDFIKYAAKYFMLTQQKFIWKEGRR